MSPGRRAAHPSAAEPPPGASRNNGPRWQQIGLIAVVTACLLTITVLTVQLLAPGKLPIAAAIFPIDAPASSPAEPETAVTVLDANVAEATQKQQLVQQPPAPGQPLRIQSPELGLDVPIVPTVLPADRTFNPASNVLAYWIRGFGIAGPEAKNTLYLAAHSWNNGYAAFNPLMDQRIGSSTAKAGQKLSVQTAKSSYSYTVAAVADYAKSNIVTEPEMWKAVPGRLVLVTCFQLNDAGANRNLVVYAQLDQPTQLDQSNPGPQK